MELKLKEMRKKRKMTQMELSKKSGVSHPTIVRLESGKPADVKLGTLRKLASALDCKLQIFLE